MNLNLSNENASQMFDYCDGVQCECGGSSVSVAAWVWVWMVRVWVWWPGPSVRVSHLGNPVIFLVGNFSSPTVSITPRSFHTDTD